VKGYFEDDEIVYSYII